MTCTYLAKRLRELSSTKTGSYPHEFLCRTDCSACADYQPWLYVYFIYRFQVSFKAIWSVKMNVKSLKNLLIAYLLTLPLFAGVSSVKALSPAWTGSHARETLISRTHLFLPHDIPPTKKSITIKSWPTFCDQYFWKFPIWNSRADEKRWEIRM